jgi:hypothetical protein
VARADRATRTIVTLGALVVGSFSKEVGLANAVFLLPLVLRREFVPAAAGLAVVLAYLAVRIEVLGAFAGELNSVDYWFVSEKHTSAEVAERFPGGRILLFNAYNVVTQLLSVFLRIFKSGRLHASLGFVPIIVTTGLMVVYAIGLRRSARGFRGRWPEVLLLAIVANW